MFKIVYEKGGRIIGLEADEYNFMFRGEQSASASLFEDYPPEVEAILDVTGTLIKLGADDQIMFPESGGMWLGTKRVAEKQAEQARQQQAKAASGQILT